jgi:hypothetical protein
MATYVKYIARFFGNNSKIKNSKSDLFFQKRISEMFSGPGENKFIIPKKKGHNNEVELCLPYAKFSSARFNFYAQEIFARMQFS